MEFNLRYGAKKGQAGANLTAVTLLKDDLICFATDRVNNREKQCGK